MSCILQQEIRFGNILKKKNYLNNLISMQNKKYVKSLKKILKKQIIKSV